MIKGQGAERVLQALASISAPASLRQIALALEKELGPMNVPKDPTISYHLKRWKEQGVVVKDGIFYRIEANENHLKALLQILRKPMTISELTQALRVHPTFKKLFGKGRNELSEDRTGRPVDRHYMVNNMISILHARGFIEYVEGDLTGKHVITPEGCRDLGICYHCKDPIDDGLTLSHTLEYGFAEMMEGRGDKWSNTPFGHSELKSVLLHPRCFKGAMNGVFGEYDDAYKIDDCCDECGLPLSSATLRKLLTRQWPITAILEEIFSDREKAAPGGSSYPSPREYRDRTVRTMLERILKKKSYGDKTDDGSVQALRYCVEKLESDEAKIDGIVSRVFGDIRNEAYELTEPPIPSTHLFVGQIARTKGKAVAEMLNPGYRSLGLSVIYVTAKGRYHLTCFKALESAKRSS